MHKNHIKSLLALLDIINTFAHQRYFVEFKVQEVQKSKYLDAVSRLLEPEEEIELIIKQSRLWPGVPLNSVFLPVVVLVTNERIIILSRHNLGLKRNITIVPLTSLRSIRLEKGLLLSSVITAQMGSGMTDDPSAPRSIDGLTHKDARILMHHLAKQLREITKGAIPRLNQKELQKAGTISFCPTCGIPVISGSKFCHNCGERLKF